MNAWGITLLWMAVRVGLLCGVGACLYLATRRRNPAAGAWTIAVVISVVIGLSAAALAPVLRDWSIESLPWKFSPEQTSAPRNGEHTAAPSQAEASETRRPTATTKSDDAQAKQAALNSAWRQFLAEFRDQLSTTDADTGWRWPAWLAVMMLAGVGLGAARIGTALLATRRYGSQARHIADPKAWSILNEIASQLGRDAPHRARAVRRTVLALHLGLDQCSCRLARRLENVGRMRTALRVGS